MNNKEYKELVIKWLESDEVYLNNISTSYDLVGIHSEAIITLQATNNMGYPFTISEHNIAKHLDDTIPN